MFCFDNFSFWLIGLIDERGEDEDPICNDSKFLKDDLGYINSFYTNFSFYLDYNFFYALFAHKRWKNFFQKRKALFHEIIYYDGLSGGIHLAQDHFRNNKNLIRDFELFNDFLTQHSL